MRVRLLPCGERALLVEVDDLPDVLALHAQLRAVLAASGQGALVHDVVPAARTLLLTTRDPDGVAVLRALVPDAAAACPRVGPPASGPMVEIPVRYDGPDLAEVARLTGLDEAGVVAAHTGAAWRVAFTGFVPGFPYLTGGDPRLRVPRRTSPRTEVPAGAVGLAGEFSGIYPRATPGGWQLLGRTDAVLWDAARTPPALLSPGTGVRFVAVDSLGAPPPSPPGGDASPAGRPEPERALEVLRPGVLTLVQDGGRPGHAAVGLGRSGAFDRSAAALANRLVSNPPDAAVLEILLGGLAVRARGAVPVALTGARAAATVNGRAVVHAGPVYLADGDLLELGVPEAGLRTYLAAAGGVAGEAVLGSRSSDTLAGAGGGRLTAGAVVPLGTLPLLAGTVDAAPVSAPASGPVELAYLPGPREDWLADAAALEAGEWVASAESDRVGVRLEGTPLARAAAFVGRELPSEGVVRGAIQLPASGLPVLFGPDHPVTGGYPVVGVLTDASCDALAQVRPGQVVRLRRTPAA